MAVQVPRHELERHEPVEPCVERFVDDPHSTAPDFFDDAIGANQAIFVYRLRDPQRGLPTLFQWRKKFIRTLMRLQ
jgi:hypothetical protein